MRELSKLKAPKEVVCDECKRNKQARSSFQVKNVVSTSKPLQLLHLNLFGPMSVSSLNEKHYVFVIVDDFSRFTRVLFLALKMMPLKPLTTFARKWESVWLSHSQDLK